MSILNDISQIIKEGIKAVSAGEVNGIGLTITGMTVVFLGLILLSLLLHFIEPVIEWSKRILSVIGAKSRGESQQSRHVKGEAQRKMTGEEAAAVSMALILYRRMHMTEHRERLTAQSKQKKLSPWSLSGKIIGTGGFPK